jgi:hypothetical protein
MSVDVNLGHFVAEAWLFSVLASQFFPWMSRTLALIFPFCHIDFIGLSVSVRQFPSSIMSSGSVRRE